MSLGREFIFRIIRLTLICSASLLCFYIFKNLNQIPKTIEGYDSYKLKAEFEDNHIKDIEYSSSEVISDNSEIEVDNLTFKSKTAENDSYKINSLKAQKTNDGNYIMEKVSAEIDTGGDNLIITAKDAFLKDETNILSLSHNIIGKYLGYDFLSENLEISLKNKIFKSSTKVIVKDDQLRVDADSFEAESNKKIVFEGHVKTLYIPD
jgi:lipopolysaccharide export system protein LptC